MKHLRHWLILIIYHRSLGWQSNVNTLFLGQGRWHPRTSLHATDDSLNDPNTNRKRETRSFRYDFGIGKNKPLSEEESDSDERIEEPLEVAAVARNWIVPEAVVKPTKVTQINTTKSQEPVMMEDPFNAKNPVRNFELIKTRRMVA